MEAVDFLVPTSTTLFTGAFTVLSSIAVFFKVRRAAQVRVSGGRGHLFVDKDGDGTVDAVFVDTTGDGKPDTEVEYRRGE